MHAADDGIFFVEIHPAAARERGIADGDPVWLETPTGRIRVEARLREWLHPGVVCAQHGWWQGCPGLGLPGYPVRGTHSANFNLLIDGAAADPVSGSTPHRSYLCDVRRRAQ